MARFDREYDTSFISIVCGARAVTPWLSAVGCVFFSLPLFSRAFKEKITSYYLLPLLRIPKS